MSMNYKTETLLSRLDEYKALVIAEQIDYNKFYLYFPITRSTAMENTEICKEIKAYKKSQAVDPIKSLFAPITECLYQAILNNNKLNYAEYGTLLGVSEATIKRRLDGLRKARMIVRMGSYNSGYWEVVNLKDRKEWMI